jgi:kynurenine formamidase
MSRELLSQLAAALADGSIRVVDLSRTLSPDTPVIKLREPFHQSAPFRTEEVSNYDERGVNWYWNNLSMGEHTGTHFDAPVHWRTGRDHADGHTDTIAPQRLIAPACVIDCSAQAADPDFLLEPAHVEAWEAVHGRIPAGSWVLMRTDWSRRAGEAFLNIGPDGAHVPGPSARTMRFLVDERDVHGWGVETVGTDAGQGFRFDPPSPAHAIMHGANRFGLASLCNLDQLPPTGSLLVTPPLKILRGSGSPLRVLALVAA